MKKTPVKTPSSSSPKKRTPSATGSSTTTTTPFFFGFYPPLKLTMSPLKIGGFPKGNEKVFQFPRIFRCFNVLLVSGRVITGPKKNTGRFTPAIAPLPDCLSQGVVGWFQGWSHQKRIFGEEIPGESTEGWSIYLMVNY